MHATRVLPEAEGGGGGGGGGAWMSRGNLFSIFRRVYSIYMVFVKLYQSSRRWPIFRFGFILVIAKAKQTRSETLVQTFDARQLAPTVNRAN